MSDNIYTQPQPQRPAQPPRKPKKHRVRKAFTIAGVGVLGIVIGSASAATAEPEVITKTKKVEVPVEKVVTKEVEVEVTPQACIDALDNAELAFDAYSAGFKASADAMGAVQNLDVAGIEAANAKMERIQTEELEPALVTYWIVSEGCRSK